MGFNPHGRARVNARSPSAQGVCDRCGFWYNLRDLRWQWDWSGPELRNKRILVCTNTCLDVPQEQLRVLLLPPDPLPVLNARPEQFRLDEVNFLVTETTFIPFVTEGARQNFTTEGAQ
jgi:hypothetical protein